MASHRILAVNRGEKEDILTVHLRLEDSDREKIENMILKEFPKKWFSCNLQRNHKRFFR